VAFALLFDSSQNFVCKSWFGKAFKRLREGFQKVSPTSTTASSTLGGAPSTRRRRSISIRD
jgi:hypothetical protein